MSKRPRSTAARPRSRFRIVRAIAGHHRLALAALAGAAAYLLLSAAPQADAALVSRLLIAWDVALAIYLAATALTMARASAGDIARHSAERDEGAFAIMVLTLIAAAASMGAIFVELAARDRSDLAPYALAVATIVLSWLFVHAIFALHYAHEFYGDGASARGLDFPGNETPDYWDFVYFAFVIGMTFQVSDVAITNRSIRRAATVHGLLAFFFNTTIIALTVNMAANAF